MPNGRYHTVVLLILFAIWPILAAAQDATITLTPTCIASCPSGINADPALGGTSPQTFICSFIDPLPSGAVLHSITVSQSMGNGRTYAYLGTPTVTMNVDGTALGPSQSITNYSPNCSIPAVYTFPSPNYPTGFPSYSYHGTNILTETVSSGSLYTAAPQIGLTFNLPVRVNPYSGNNQTGSIGSPLEQPLVARLTGPSGYVNAGQTIHFAVAAEPARTKGTAVGANEEVATRMYDAVTDAYGYARAIGVLGDNAGSYTYTASLTGAEYNATFAATAKKPDSVVILKQTTDIARRAPTYVTSLIEPTTFHAIGLDKTGAKIGPLKVNWSLSSPLPRGSVVAGPVATTMFTPTGAGEATLTADPPTSGIPTASVSIFATQLKLLLGVIDPARPFQDDLPIYVPGTKADGMSVLASDMPQPVTLHVATPTDSTGTVNFVLADTTAYPGIAMNSPAVSATADPDMYFRPGESSQTFSPTGDTTATLYVDDYAAWAHLDCSVVIGTKTYSLDRITIPQDIDNNRIPDGGWRALANSATGALTQINDSLPVSDDSETDPVVAGLPLEGISGDGLTVFEEYRGFVVRGEHRRLNPYGKDLFIMIEPIDDGIDDRVAELPLTLHEIRVAEGNGLVAPEINPNRAGIAGAIRQCGVRARNRYPSPGHERLDGSIVPADFDFSGYTYANVASLDLITSVDDYGAEPGSPNEMVASETFDYAFWRHYISYGPTGGRDTVVASTDTDDPAHSVIRGVNPTTGGAHYVDSIPVPDDFATTTLFTSCADWRYPPDPNRAWTALATPEDLLQYYQDVFLHEVAHSIDITHDTVQCTSSVMTDDPALPLARPLTDQDLRQIRIHHKHR